MSFCAICGMLLPRPQLCPRCHGTGWNAVTAFAEQIRAEVSAHIHEHPDRYACDPNWYTERGWRILTEATKAS